MVCVLLVLPGNETRLRATSGKVSRPKLSQMRWLFRRHSIETSVPILDPSGKRLVQAMQLRARLGADR